MTDKMGSLVIDLQGLSVSPEERELLKHPLIGGVIFFAQNYASRGQMQAFCQEIRRASNKPLLIMVDQEGGRVQRFIEDFTRLPYMSVFGKIYEENSAMACHMATDCGWLMATELLSLGIDMSLAPVLDLNKGVSSIIGQRAFHTKPEAVIELAQAYIKGMSEAGMASTGKHFPGHGSVTLDSHVAVPYDDRTMREIERDDMIPFAKLIQSGINAMMAAHIIFPKIDKKPVGYSRYWLTDVLRGKLGFKGVIFSDDLNMEGANISKNYADRVVAAKEAGCDFALLCNNRSGVIQVLDSLSPADFFVEREKWGLLQSRFLPQQQSFQTTVRWQKTHNFLLSIYRDQPESWQQFFSQLNKLES